MCIDVDAERKNLILSYRPLHKMLHTHELPIYHVNM